MVKHRYTGNTSISYKSSRPSKFVRNHFRCQSFQIFLNHGRVRLESKNPIVCFLSESFSVIQVQRHSHDNRSQRTRQLPLDLRLSSSLQWQSSRSLHQPLIPIQILKSRYRPIITNNPSPLSRFHPVLCHSTYFTSLTRQPPKL